MSARRAAGSRPVRHAALTRSRRLLLVAVALATTWSLAVPGAALGTTEPPPAGEGAAAAAEPQLGMGVDSLVEAGNALTDATVGELVTLTASVRLPAGPVVDAAVLELRLPAGLVPEDGTLGVTYASGTAPEGAVLAVDGRTARLTVPDGWTAPGDGTEVVTLTWAGRPADVATVVAGAVLEAAATFTASRAGVPTELASTAPVVVVEPRITASTGQNQGTGGVYLGSSLIMSAGAANAADASVAHDVVVVDHVASGYEPLTDDGTLARDGDRVGFGGSGVWDADTRTITFDPVDVEPGGFAEPFFEVQVPAAPPADATFGNAASVTASSLPGAHPGERTAASPHAGPRYADSAAFTLVAPPLWTLVSVGPSPAAVGDVVTVRLDATLPSYTEAYDITVLDTVPAGLEYLDTLSASCTRPVGCAADGATLERSGRELAWFFGDVQQDEWGTAQVATVVYRARVISAPEGGGVVTNAARTGHNAVDRLDAPAGVTDVGTLDVTGGTTPARLELAAPPATPATVRLTTATATSLTAPGNGRDQATVGEDVTWTLDARLGGAGATLSGAVLGATLPAALAPAGPGSETPPQASLAGGALPAGAALTVTGQRVQVTLPDGWPVPDAGATLRLRFTARVRDVPEVRHAGSLDVGTTFSARDGSGALVSASASAPTGVVEPDVAVFHGTNNVFGMVSPGSGEMLSVGVWNSSAASTAYDVVAVSALPESFHPDGPDFEPAVDGGPVGYGGDGVWDQETHTITWDVGDVAPGAEREYYFQASVASPLPDRAHFRLVATATATSLPGDAAGERTARTGPDRYAARSTLTFGGPIGYVTLVAEPATAAVGDVVTLTTVVTPTFDEVFDLTIDARLPEGLEYVETVTTGCVFGSLCPQGPAVVLGPEDGEVAWFLGDAPAIPDVGESRVLGVTFRARVVDAAALRDGAVLTPSTGVSWNLTDRVTAPASLADLGTRDWTSERQEVDVVVAAPAVEAAVQVTGADGTPLGDRAAAPGERLLWQVTLTGTGGGDAHDLLLTVATDPRLGRASGVTGATALDDDASGDGVLRFAVPHLASGAAITVSFVLAVPWPVPGTTVGDLSSGLDVTWSSQPGDVPGEATGSASAEPVVVPVGHPGGMLAGRVRTASLADGSLLRYEADVGVQVVWLGPDRAPGGGDDVGVATATGPDGRWAVARLRPGWYQVRFDPVTLPGLTVPWRDSDGGPPLVTTVHVAKDQVRPRTNLVLAAIAPPP